MCLRRGETNLLRFDYSHEAGDLGASFVTRATPKAALYIAQFRKRGTLGFRKMETNGFQEERSFAISFIRPLLSLLPICFFSPRTIKDRPTFRILRNMVGIIINWQALVFCHFNRGGRGNPGDSR